MSERATYPTSGPKFFVAVTITACIASVVAVAALMRVPGYVSWVPMLGTEMLTIESKDSRAKILATTKPDGVARLWMHDPDGKALLSAEVGRGWPQVILQQADGTALLRIEIMPNGKPRIRLVDPSGGKPAWTVTVDETGKPRIE